MRTHYSWNVYLSLWKAIRNDTLTIAAEYYGNITWKRLSSGIFRRVFRGVRCLKHQVTKAVTSETSVNIYHNTRWNVSEDSHLHTPNHHNLKYILCRVFTSFPYSIFLKSKLLCPVKNVWVMRINTNKIFLLFQKLIGYDLNPKTYCLKKKSVDFL
jgi:hypothetical protein